MRLLQEGGRRTDTLKPEPKATVTLVVSPELPEPVEEVAAFEDNAPSVGAAGGESQAGQKESRIRSQESSVTGHEPESSGD
jgi:hypothetical protein